MTSMMIAIVITTINYILTALMTFYYALHQFASVVPSIMCFVIIM